MITKNNATNGDVLKQRIDEILFYVWDPIGININGFPAGRDEYSSYVPMLMQLLSKKCSIKQVADVLSNIRIERIGLPPDTSSDYVTAESIIEWHDQLIK